MRNVHALSLALVATLFVTALSPPSRAQDDESEDGSATFARPIPAPPPYSGSDGVDLEVQTDSEIGAYLMQAAPAGPSAGWAQLCLLPCRLRVDPRRTYKIGGLGVSESENFELHSGGRASLYVHPTSAGVAIIGWTFFGLGAVMTTVGTLVIAGAPSAPADSDQSTTATEARDSRMARFLGGGVVLGVGIPFLLIGAAALFGSGSTTVTEGETGARIAATRLSDDVWLTPRGIVF